MIGYGTGGNLLPVDVQLLEDAAMGEAWRRCEAALPYEWAILITYCGDDGPPVWRVSAGEDIRTVDPKVYVEGSPAAALAALAEKLEARR